jgi:hypothetical protein
MPCIERRTSFVQQPLTRGSSACLAGHEVADQTMPADRGMHWLQGVRLYHRAVIDTAKAREEHMPQTLLDFSSPPAKP